MLIDKAKKNVAKIFLKINFFKSFLVFISPTIKRLLNLAAKLLNIFPFISNNPGYKIRKPANSPILLTKSNKKVPAITPPVIDIKLL